MAYEDKLRFYDTSVIKDTIKYETETNLINKRNRGGYNICHKVGNKCNLQPWLNTFASARGGDRLESWPDTAS